MAKKIIIGGLVLLLLGGGAGGYLALAGENIPAEGQEASVQQNPPEFLPIRPITLPVLRGDRVRSMVAFRIVLELSPGTDPADLRGWLPRVEDAFVTELASLLAVDWPGTQLIDFDIARERLSRESDRVMGQGVVVKVLFEHIQPRVL